MNKSKVTIKTETKVIVGRLSRKTVKQYVVFKDGERVQAFDNWLVACKMRDAISN